MGLLLWSLGTRCAVPMMTPPPPLTMRSGWVSGGLLQSDIYDLQVEAHGRTLDGTAYVEYTRGKERWEAAPGILGLVIPFSPTRRYMLEVWGMPMVIRGMDGDFTGRKENTRVGAVMVGAWGTSPVFPERMRLYVSGGVWVGSQNFRLMKGEFITEAIEILAVVRDPRGMVQVSGSLYPPGVALQVRLPGTPVEVYALTATPWIHRLPFAEAIRRMRQWMFGPLAGSWEVYRYPLYLMVGGGVRLGF